MATTPRHGSRWRRRFFIAGGALLACNIVLLILLARAHFQPREVLDGSNRDARLLAALLASKLSRNELKDRLVELQWTEPAREQGDKVHVGGVTFHFGADGKLREVEHWSKPLNR